MKENIIIKIQKLYSQPRNFRVCNKPPALFLKKTFLHEQFIAHVQNIQCEACDPN